MRTFVRTNPRRAVLLTLCLLLAAGAGRAQDSFLEATRHEQARDYESALANYEAFLDQHPQDRLAPVAATAVANIHFLAREDPDAAIEAYDRVVTDYPESGWAAEAARRKAECLRETARLSEAGEAYGRALELAGRGGESASTDWINEVSLAAADCFYQVGDRQQVIETYEKVLDSSLSPGAIATSLYRLADCYEAGGEEQKAAERYAQILESHPFSEMFAQALEKRELVERYHELDWASCETFARAQERINRRDYAEAKRLSDQIQSTSKNEVLCRGARYRSLVSEMILSGRFSEGTQQLQEFLQELPSSETIPNMDEMLEFYTRIAGLEERVRQNPEDPATLQEFGHLSLRAGATSRAVEALEQAVALDPENPDVHLVLGYAYAASATPEEAAPAFQFYLDRNPDDGNVCNQVGYTYLNLGDPETAITYFRRYGEAAPDEANAHDSLGEGYLRAGRLEEAAAEYETAVRLDPSFANPHFMLGTVYGEMGRTRQAIASYERLLELTPTGPQAEQARTALDSLRQE